VGQHRTTQRWRSPVATGQEERLRRQLRRLAREQPRWGYKRVWGRLRLDGWPVNRKRVQRLWRDEGLRVPAAPPKRSRVGTSTAGAERLSAQHPNQVWALDILFDTTSDGRPFKVFSMCDEFTRESVGGKVARSITADDVVVILDSAAGQRGVPKFIRCDNGPEFIAAAIRDWCRFSGAGAAYIDPGSPWQNPFVESFNSRARDELFAREIFHSIMEAQVLYEDWRNIYNTYRPHSALNWLPPAQYASQWSGATIQ
jgi:putative transposase